MVRNSLPFVLATLMPFMGFAASWTDSDGVVFEYNVDKSGTASVYVTSCTPGSSIDFPSQVDGYRVSRIGCAWWVGGAATSGAGCQGEFVSASIPDGVTSIGDYAFVRRSSLSSITIPNGVTSIGDYAFAGCSSLSSITIPDSVTSIGERAFSNCRGLSSIEFSDSVASVGSGAFLGCSGLADSEGFVIVKNVLYDYVGDETNVKIPEGVTHIGGWAFEGRSDLASVTIPDSVTSVDNSAFSGCSGLASVALPNGLTNIGARAFYNCSGLSSVRIPGSVRSLGSSAFEGCNGLASITIPETVRNVGLSAFAKCSNLTSATIPLSVVERGVEWVFSMNEKLASITISDDVTYIRSPSFRDCKSLTSLKIPDSVKEIQDGAFEGCSESLYDTTTIPGLNMIDGWVIGYNSDCPADLRIEGVRGVADNAFRGCEDLKSVAIADDVRNIGWGVFSSCSAVGSVSLPAGMTEIGFSMFEGCTSLSTLLIPEGVTTIGEGAFSYCRALYSIEIPQSVTNIGAWSFANCASLQSITIPNSVREIGTQAFYACDSLLDVVFADGAMSIGDYAFSDCKCLFEVTIPDSMETVGAGAFQGCGLWEVSIPEDADVGENAFDSNVNIIRRRLKTSSITYANLRGAANPNPTTYKEGRNLELLPPGAISDFVFAGWSPARITWDMKGEKTVTANWVRDPKSFPRAISETKISVSLPDAGYKYDGTAKEPAVSVMDTLAGFSSSDYAVTYEDNVNAGTAKVVVTGVGNYTGTVEVAFAIAPRELTFTSADCEWVYDGAAHSCTTTPDVSGDGFVGEDNVVFSDFASVVSLGRYENTFSYAFTKDTVASNYSVTQVCGLILVSDFKMTIKEDGTVRIDGFGNELSGSSELVIPERICGIPVTEIGAGAFVNLKARVTTLVLPKYCKKIGASAFRGIRTLRNVIFTPVYETDDMTPAALDIGAYAFASTGIEVLDVPDYVQSLGDYALANCGSLRRVTTGPLTRVSGRAFYRSGVAVKAKPEVVEFGSFDFAGSAVTMTLKGTSGTIDVAKLKVLFYSRVDDPSPKEMAYRVVKTEATPAGCEVTIMADVPTDAMGGFFRAKLDD